jgi:circadian clock protein KaiC
VSSVVGDDPTPQVPRVQTGVPGLDAVTHGGLPEGRLTLVSGTAGSGKTVLATQFLAGAIDAGDSGVFVTFEERPPAIRENMRSFGWDIAAFEEQGRWAFVDASDDFRLDVSVVGDYDLSPLIARVTHALEETGAKRVAIDAVGALFAQFEDARPARRALFRLSTALHEAGVTSLVTVERTEDYGPVAHFGFEEFLADNVIILRNSLAEEKRRRTIEVLKMRGGSHARGEHLCSLRGDRGLIVVPNVGFDFEFEASTERVTSGNAALDEMLHGGLFARSLTLVAGGTGAGKSLLATQFAAGGAEAGERSLFLSLEESRHQIVRNAAAWGYDFEAMEESGDLTIIAEPPEAMSLEDHLLRLKMAIDDLQPTRVAIDSLTALERVATVESFREYVIGLTFHMKKQNVTGLMTATTMKSSTEIALTDLHISTITDTILMLQYVQVDGSLLRGINVVKMRGSDHAKQLREYRIDDTGLNIRGPFRGVRGMMSLTGAESVSEVSG